METKVLTLTDFLLARIAEDEARCGRFHDYDCLDLRNLRFYGWKAGEALGCDCAHPPRIMAECEAKRRIVEMTAYDAYGFDEVQKLLALPYADHPDYRQEWKP